MVTVHAPPLGDSVQCVIESVELERFVSSSVRDLPPFPLPLEATTRSQLGLPTRSVSEGERRLIIIRGPDSIGIARAPQLYWLFHVLAPVALADAAGGYTVPDCL